MINFDGYNVIDLFTHTQSGISTSQKQRRRRHKSGRFVSVPSDVRTVIVICHFSFLFPHFQFIVVGPVMPPSIIHSIIWIFLNNHLNHRSKTELTKLLFLVNC